jgi:hypothetical protein
MKRRIKYTDEPLGEVRIVRDFLPPPEKLVLKQENVKVTMTLSKSSVDFFKRVAHKHHAPYQRMIRRLVDEYVARHAAH